jgi:hypothetical protein
MHTKQVRQALFFPKLLDLTVGLMKARPGRELARVPLRRARCGMRAANRGSGCGNVLSELPQRGPCGRGVLKAENGCI